MVGRGQGILKCQTPPSHLALATSLLLLEMADGCFAFKLEQSDCYSGPSLPELVLQRPQGGL